jgi:hypothetical protein
MNFLTQRTRSKRGGRKARRYHRYISFHALCAKEFLQPFGCRGHHDTAAPDARAAGAQEFNSGQRGGDVD